MEEENGGKGIKTVWIVLGVVLGIVIIGGLISGIVYYLQKNISKETSSSTQVAEIRDLTTYTNTRYGFSFNYPKSFTKTESQNGDGVTLVSEDPQTTIRVYGSNNALSQNLDEYLNESRNSLFQEQGDAEEILAEDVTLGGIPAQERQWKYTDSAIGEETIVDQVTGLKDDVFYTAQMVVISDIYNEYPAHVFNEIINTYTLN